MNRNVEAHFSELPNVELSRSTFDISQSHKFTANVGQLIPFYVQEVLPGDTFQVTTSKVVRLQTLVAPIMDNLYLDTYFFFVPNRLVWDHWRNFMGENTESAWLSPTEYRVPTVHVVADRIDITPPDPSARTRIGALSGSIFDYMGIPVNCLNDFTEKGLHVNALPIRGYSLIWSEFFRDQNLQDPVNLYTGDAEQEIRDVVGATIPLRLPGIPAYGECQMWPWRVARYHDYFSSCLPAPQKGPDVMIPGFPANGVLPVTTTSNDHYASGIPLKFVRTADGQSSGYVGNQNVVGPNESLVSVFTRTSLGGQNLQEPVNLWALMNSDAVSTINNLRLAFQVQKLYERDARGGTRYIELLRSHFGVVSSDARLQRPEYLGGNRISLNVAQVTNNTQSDADAAFLGDLGAFSHTADVHGDFVKSFEEHGFVIGVCAVRYDHTYSQGLERFWSRRGRFDYYWPVFANIGEQPVYKEEICALADDSDSDVFGYQEAWADYRYKPNRVSGQMRPNIENSLAFWNLADDYEVAPTLSSGWLEEDPEIVDRVLAVNHLTADQLLFDVYTQCRATRVMPVHSIPGLADHH